MGQLRLYVEHRKSMYVSRSSTVQRVLCRVLRPPSHRATEAQDTSHITPHEARAWGKPPSNGPTHVLPRTNPLPTRMWARCINVHPPAWPSPNRNSDGPSYLSAAQNAETEGGRHGGLVPAAEHTNPSRPPQPTLKQASSRPCACRTFPQAPVATTTLSHCALGTSRLALFNTTIKSPCPPIMTTITQMASSSAIDASPFPPAANTAVFRGKDASESATPTATTTTTTTTNKTTKLARDTKYRHVFATHALTRTSCLSHDADKSPSFVGFRNLMILVLSTHSLTLTTLAHG